MPEPAVSWKEVRGIHFSFGHHFGCGNKQWQLNTAFAQTLPNIASLFIVDEDGVETLRPDPIPVLKSLIVTAIVDELPASQVFTAHKQRIALLISNSAIFCHVKDHARSRVRNKRGLDKAARRANNGDPIVRLVLTIFSWEFHKDWYPYEFHKVYDPGYGVPLDEAMLQRKTPFHTQTNNKLQFNNKLIEQFKRERNGETVQQALPPKRKRPKTTRPTTGGLNPIKPIESEVEPAIKVPTYCVTSSSATTALPTIKSIDSDVVTTPSNTTTSDTPSINAPCYILTWTYSPQSESVSFRRVRPNSISFRRATSSGPHVQRQDRFTVTSISVTPSTLPGSDHHSAPPCKPTNFVWTFNPQNEIATFRRVPTTSVPTSQPPIPNRPPVLRLSKRHRDALKVKLCFTPPNYLPRRHRDAIQIKLYQLHATLLIANLLYDDLTPSSAIPHSVFSWCPFLQTLFWTSVNDDNSDGLFGQFITSALLRSLLRHSVISLSALSSALVFLSCLFTPYFSLPPSSIVLLNLGLHLILILLYGLKPLILCDYIVFLDLIDQQWNQSSTTLESLRIKSRLIPAIVSYIPATPICSESPLLVNQGVYVLCPKATTTGFAYSGIH
eukprot:jgi/Psemu1/2866/gm1.2866_g